MSEMRKESPIANITNRLEDFWKFVDIRGPNDCWEWTKGKRSDGYGRFMHEGVRERSHRIAWKLSNKREIGKYKVIMHTCDNPSCCNPAHLVEGTDMDNMQDCSRKGRLKVQRDHEISPERMLEIREEARIFLGNRRHKCQCTK